MKAHILIYFFSKIKEALKYMNTFQMYVLFLDSIEAY